jgi:hypothetical protein
MMPRFSAPTALRPGRSLLDDYLAQRATETTFAAGQTIGIGWWFFRLDDDADGSLVVQAPELGWMPIRWQGDCSHALNSVLIQKYIVESFGSDFGWCRLVDSAVVSKSVVEGCEVFINRLSAGTGADSGWFVGSRTESLDVDDPANLVRWSLWEVAVRFPVVLPYLLLPSGCQVLFEDRPVVLRDFRPISPLPGSYAASL